MELSGPAPLGAQAAIAAQVQQRKPVDVQKVDPGRQADSSGTDARQRPEQDQTAASARDIANMRHQARQQARQRDLPAGPTPAFEVSLLEMESDLKQVIARVESARNQERNAQAVKAPAEAEAERLRAEMAAEQARAAAAQTEADAASATARASAELNATGAAPVVAPVAAAAPAESPAMAPPPQTAAGLDAPAQTMAQTSAPAQVPAQVPASNTGAQQVSETPLDQAPTV